MPETLKAITVSLALASLAVGSTTQATRTTERDGTDSSDDDDFPIAWSSSDPTKATVDANGLVTAKAVGSAQIRATSGAITGAADLTVTAPVVPVIDIPAATFALIAGAPVGSQLQLREQPGGALLNVQVSG